MYRQIHYFKWHIAVAALVFTAGQSVAFAGANKTEVIKPQANGNDFKITLSKKLFTENPEDRFIRESGCAKNSGHKKSKKPVSN